MKKKASRPARHKFSVLRQICNLIPPFLTPKLGRETGVDKKARTFSVWSHLVSMLYAQLTHCISLNDVCDGLRLHRGELNTIRGATPPSRNNLSHANRHRSPVLVERLFWEVLGHLQRSTPEFARGRGRPLRRFKRAIHAVDSSTIKLIMSCFSWAQHRRRKAAAKLHLRLNLQSFLPGYAIVDKAKGHDNQKAWELCAGLKAGEIVIFDMAYVAFAHLWELMQRKVWWVSRVRDNQQFKVVKKLQRKRQGKIIRDDLIRLTGPKSRRLYPVGRATPVRAAVLSGARGSQRTASPIDSRLFHTFSATSPSLKNRDRGSSAHHQLRSLSPPGNHHPWDDAWSQR